MSRIIYVPQYPTKLRYQEFWMSEFTKVFEDNFDEVIVLGENYIDKFVIEERMPGMFSGINNAIYLEQLQIVDYMKIELKDDDILFLADLSFPGFFSNILHHKKPKKCFAYCHATSLNAHDYFQSVRQSKWLTETGHSKLFDIIFVGSEYHKIKLGWNNTTIIGVPKPPFKTFNYEKNYEIISVSRPSIQKVTKKIEKQVIRDFGEILRKPVESWEEYYKFLSQANVVLLSGKEETFGYTVMEAVMNNSVPLAPKKYSYPELLSSDYLYDDYEDLRYKIWQVFDGQIKPPKELENQFLVDDFYVNLISLMKG